MLLKLLIVVVKIPELFWQDVGIWRQVKCCFAEFFLHADEIKAKPVFLCDFLGIREFVDLLVFVESFILIGLARA